MARFRIWALSLLASFDPYFVVASPTAGRGAQYYLSPDNEESFGGNISELKIAIETLQTKFFDYKSGEWPRSIDWTGAVLGTILAATTKTLSIPDYDLSNQYLTQLQAYYFSQNTWRIKREAYDDILWVVLNWLEGVKLIDYRTANKAKLPHNARTGEEWRTPWAERAQDFYQLAQTGWDTTLCKGGMLWDPKLEPYKNAITNELWISASISMYLYHPSPPRKRIYLENAIEAHKWLRNSNMTDAAGLYTDGFHIKNLRTGGTNCDNRDEMVYTYNQGVLLSGLRGLAEATGDESYVHEGIQLIDDVLGSEGSVGEIVLYGILTEKCDPSSSCSQNGHTFKAIWMHHLTLFCEPLTGAWLPSSAIRKHAENCKRYKKFVYVNAKAALSTRNSDGVMGSWWGVPFGWQQSDFMNRDTRPPGSEDLQNNCPMALTVKVCEKNQREYSYSDGMWPKGQPDLNDRGRGRTVESHLGGVAAIRALLEL